MDLRRRIGLVLLAVAAVMATGCVPPGVTVVRAPETNLERWEPPVAKVVAAEEQTAAARAFVEKRWATDPRDRFDATAAMRDAVAIAAYGPRPGGSRAESQAAAYVEARMQELGYQTEIQPFDLPNGKTSRNVVAVLPGATSGRQIILGAHFDTKPKTPGANDNASGCGVLIEMARLLRERPADCAVRFVFFGTEEFLADAPGDNHHLGSRHDAARMNERQRADTAAMISIDMVGYGSRMVVRDMRRGPRTLTAGLLSRAETAGVKLAFDRDRGGTGWSDHEPYELRGIPAAWIQWQLDPQYHSPGDNAGHLQRRPFEVTGRLLMDFVRSIDAKTAEKYCDR